MTSVRDLSLPSLSAAALCALSACSQPVRPDLPPLPEPLAAQGIDLEQLELGIVLDPLERTIEADCELTWHVQTGPTQHVELAYAGPEPLEVLDANLRALPFDHTGERLVVELIDPWLPDSIGRLRVRYAGAVPRGLWFEGTPAQGLGGATRVVADAEASARAGWLPTTGSPASERARTVLRLDMPEGWTAVAPGERVERAVAAGRVRERWETRSEQPLEWIGFAAGEFDSAAFESGGVRFLLLTQGNDPSWLEPSLRESGPMLGFFSGLFGVAYPHPRFTELCLPVEAPIVLPQAAVLPDRLLGDELARRDDEGYLELAGALARQWLGGTLQPAPGHEWLDEGLAGYAALLYGEQSRDPDVHRLELRRAQRLAVEHPDALVGFDVTRHGREALVARSASRMELLRRQLGDETFFAGLADYVAQNQGRQVRTSDLQASMELASRENLEAFFADWVESPGDPRLELRWSWDADASEVVLETAQTHDANGGAPAAYRATVEVEMRAGSRITQRELELSARRETHRFALEEAPTWVRFDRQGALPKRLRFDRGGTEWLSIAAQDLDPIGRVEAVAGLGELARAHRGDELGAIYRAQVRDRALNDTSAAVRAAAVRELGRIGGLEARTRLEQVAQNDPQGRVRVAALEALAEFGRDAKLAGFAEEQFDEGFSWSTRIAAAGLYAAAAPDDARRWLSERLVIASPQERLRAGLIDVLAGLDGPEVVPQLAGWARDRQAACAVRVAAIEGLALREPRSEQVGQQIASLLSDRERRVRRAALEALVRRQDEVSRATIDAYAATATSAEERRLIEAAWRSGS